MINLIVVSPSFPINSQWSSDEVHKCAAFDPKNGNLETTKIQKEDQSSPEDVIDNSNIA